MISVHIEAQSAEELKGILAGLAASYANGASAPVAATSAPAAAPKATKKETAAAAPAPVVEAPAPAPAADGAKVYTREAVMPMYADAAAKDRPGLIKLLGDFGAAKLSVLPDDKLNAFGAALETFLASK